MSSETQGLLWFIGGGLLAISYALKPDWWCFTNFVAVASAVGTIAAAWAALWLAGRSERKQEHEASQRASLAAASVIAQLEGAMSDLQTAAAAMVYMDAGLDMAVMSQRDTAHERAARAIVACVEREDWDLDPQLVQAMLPLPDRTAHRIEYACRSIATLRRDVKATLQTWGEHTTHQHGRYIGRWTGTLMAAHNYLVAAMVTCEAAAGIEGLHPTPEEIYGEPNEKD